MQESGWAQNQSGWLWMKNNFSFSPVGDCTPNLQVYNKSSYHLCYTIPLWPIFLWEGIIYHVLSNYRQLAAIRTLTRIVYSVRNWYIWKLMLVSWRQYKQYERSFNAACEMAAETQVVWILYIARHSSLANVLTFCNILHQQVKFICSLYNVDIINVHTPTINTHILIRPY